MVGYSANAKAYRVYNESTGIVEETYDVKFDESNERYGGIDGDEDEEEQRKAMKKMPKGEIKPQEDGEEIVGQNQAQGQESPHQEQISPSRSANQEQVTSSQAIPQASTSRPRTRQQARIEVQTQGNDAREGQSSPIRGSILFEQPNNEQANNDSEDDG